MANSKILRHVCLAAALGLVVCCADVALGCPTCKDQLAADPASANLVRGYFWSILFMLSMPFLILTGLSTYFYWEVRRARRRAGQLPAQPTAADRACFPAGIQTAEA